MEIIWHGHSCFEIVEQDYHIVIDPYEPGSCGDAYPDLHLEADEVLVSHEHRDHCYRDGVKLRTGRTSPFTITTQQSYHDVMRGTLRGMNTIHILEANGMKVIHMGDIGMSPMPKELPPLKNADVLMIPTGGIFTIEPNSAFYLTEKLSPRVAIPMHFKVPGHSNWHLREREDYTGIFTEQPIMPVKVYDSNRLTVTAETEPHVAYLKIPGKA